MTVADLRNGLLAVSLVPLTLDSTNLGAKNPGDCVNIEVDIFSKYIERHLTRPENSINDDMLLRVGILPMGWIDN